MAVPSSPTSDTIIWEALSKANRPGAYGRAKREWIQEAMNWVWLGLQKPKIGQEVKVKIADIGVNRYSLNDDFESFLSVTLLDGSVRDTAQSGGNNTVTLAAGETATEADVVGSGILIYGGTGKNGYLRAKAYNTGTKAAVMEADWTANPNNTSAYMIVPPASEKALYKTTQQKIDETIKTEGLADMYAESNRELHLDRIPDQVYYGIRLRYYVRPTKLDLTGTIITDLYDWWRIPLTQYVYMMAMQDKGMDITNEWTLFNGMLSGIQVRHKGD